MVNFLLPRQSELHWLESPVVAPDGAGLLFVRPLHGRGGLPVLEDPLLQCGPPPRRQPVLLRGGSAGSRGVRHPSYPTLPPLEVPVLIHA